MASTREQLESFTQFAAERLSHGDPEPSLDVLLMEWADRRDRPLINEAIQRGLADVAAGRHEPAERTMERIRNEFGFPKE